MAAEVKVEVIQTYGVLSEGKWWKELNKVSWNGRTEIYDIRGWSPDHKVCSKGITLNRDELLKLRDVLNSMEI